MKKVIIAEKPSVAKNIADALAIKTRKDGYFEGDDYLITWAFGHLLQLYDAKDYDETMKSWVLEKFPFIPETFKYKVKSDSKNKVIVDKGAQKQINIIKGWQEGLLKIQSEYLEENVEICPKRNSKLKYSGKVQPHFHSIFTDHKISTNLHQSFLILY